MPPAPPQDADAGAAREHLERLGWRQIARGDWSWVLVDLQGARAARVTPFDPAYLMHARACLEGPPNRWLPRVEAIWPLRRDGYVTVMELLKPAPEAEAAAFCAALGVGNDSGYVPRGAAAALAPDEDLLILRDRVEALIAAGARRYRVWGGSDVRPGNVMMDVQGGLRLVDPVFLSGPKIVEAIQSGRIDLLADFSHGQLEDFLTIPAFTPGPGAEDLRRKLAELFGGAGAA